MKRLLAALLIALATAPAASFAQKLYAASVRNLTEGGAESIGGSLYAVVPTTGVSTFVAPIQLEGGVPLGITGLAAHPLSGVLYGITSPLSRSNPLSLVTISPLTGDAKMVGHLGVMGSDIAFSRGGTLFIWLPETSQIGVVNLDTGAATPIGTPRSAGSPAGLAIDDETRVFITLKGASGTLDTIDIATGAVTPGPAMKGAPFDTLINSMTFTPEGKLIAVNSNGGSPSNAKLVSIDTATGAVTTLGNMPDDTDGLTFASPVTPEASVPVNWRNVALISLLLLGVALAGFAWAMGRKAA
ncbi:MAG: hypothetical protein ABIQ72_06815 [Usitatibacter sp.]